MDVELSLALEPVTAAAPAALVAVEPSTPLRDVLAQMREASTGAVAVCSDGVLLGLFTERDALRQMAARADLSAPIGRLMAAPVVTVSPAASVCTAVHRMAQGGYRRLPIVDPQGRPLGMIDVAGIVHFLVEHFPGTIYNLPPTPHSTLDREGP